MVWDRQPTGLVEPCGNRFGRVFLLSNGHALMRGAESPQPLSIAANLPELGEISTWAGLVAPAGTPPAIVTRIHRDVAAVAADPEVGARLQAFGIVATSSTPSELDRYFRSALERWSSVFRDSGITLD